MGRTLLIGCGGVGSCTLYMLGRLPDFDLSTLTIIDKSEKVAASTAVHEACARGATFIKVCVSRSNWKTLLNRYLGHGDVLIDLSFGIRCEDLLGWCQRHNVNYINTAIETWEDELIPENNLDDRSGRKSKERRGEDWTQEHKELYDRTLYARHLQIANTVTTNNGPTAVLEHGCNPGLVSHFVRAALDDIVDATLRIVPNGERSDALREFHSSGDYPRVAMTLGLRVVHISEIDTQTSARPKREGEFLNTWSPMGFVEEALDWVQVGWGTHERPIPRMLTPSEGSQGQIFVPIHSMNMVLDSYVPYSPIKGMCIPHGEADTIALHLTVFDKTKKTNRKTSRADQVVYRPSVYYVYQCCGVAMESLKELKRRDCVPQTKYHVLTPADGVKGEDKVGVLLMFEDDPVRVLRGRTGDKKPWSYWYGSILSNTNNPLRNFNPTVVQVGASVLGALKWIKENPYEGVCWPDDLPHKFILDLAAPYLGTIISAPMKDYVPPASLQFADFMCRS